MVCFPRARAAVTPARSSSTGRSEDDGICNGMGEEGQGAGPCLTTLCVGLPPSYLTGWTQVMGPEQIPRPARGSQLHFATGQVTLSPGHCCFGTAATLCL